MIQNIAHRGASAYEPENTLRAFELALAMEATMIEVDIHLSADGHPVVMHDAQLCRTTNGQGKIDDCGAKIFHHIIKGELLKPLFDYKLFSWSSGKRIFVSDNRGSIYPFSIIINKKLCS